MRQSFLTVFVIVALIGVGWTLHLAHGLQGGSHLLERIKGIGKNGKF